jgi:hypothetical protein
MTWVLQPAVFFRRQWDSIDQREGPVFASLIRDSNISAWGSLTGKENSTTELLPSILKFKAKSASFELNEVGTSGYVTNLESLS